MAVPSALWRHTLAAVVLPERGQLPPLTSSRGRGTSHRASLGSVQVLLFLRYVSNALCSSLWSGKSGWASSKEAPPPQIIILAWGSP